MSKNLAKLDSTVLSMVDVRVKRGLMFKQPVDKSCGLDLTNVNELRALREKVDREFVEFSENNSKLSGDTTNNEYTYVAYDRIAKYIKRSIDYIMLHYDLDRICSGYLVSFEQNSAIELKDIVVLNDIPELLPAVYKRIANKKDISDNSIICALEDIVDDNSNDATSTNFFSDNRS